MSEGSVPFLDLKRRVEALRASLETEVGRVFERGRFIMGDSGAEIERELAKYCGVAHGVGVAPCSRPAPSRCWWTLTHRR